MEILNLRNISKTFTQGSNTTSVLKDVNLTIISGEICSLVGPSGCGKSTLLHIAGLLESTTTGEIVIDGIDCSIYSDVMATKLRGQKIGFIYQFHHLLPEFTALENVVMPLLIAGIPYKIAINNAKEILNEFSLSQRFHNIPSELSGGEQQRVAIARAMIHQPKLLLADEPTGNLDEENAKIVFEQFLKISKERGVAVLMVTHNLELAKKTDRILTINNGIVESHQYDNSRNQTTSKTPRGRSTRTKSPSKNSPRLHRTSSIKK